VSAISVSNHGGNNLDGTPATIRALAAVVEAVGDEVEVVLDGGIRRGSDVVKALALGARAVMIGRACLWGLAAAGQPGVENVLDILRSGIDSTLLGLGHASIHDLSPDDLLVAPGFERRFGAPRRPAARPSHRVRLGQSTWPDLGEDAPRRLLIPLGATEQHGPHLPLQTDTLIAVAIAEAAAAERRDVVIAPALPYGASGEHAGFPGTLSLGRAAVEAAIVELVRSADHFDDVVLLSWHGGNAQPVDRAVTRLRARAAGSVPGSRRS